MGASCMELKKEIVEYIRTFDNPIILDVGAGAGNYRHLLPGLTMDAVEIWTPYITKYELFKYYRNIYNTDIRGFKYDYYDIIIFGDILEHLTIKDAQDVLEYACNHCNELIVSLPYEYEQGIVNDNINEVHLQSDLTPENILERYPMLELVKKGNVVGFYKKKND
jgi:uncharacterized protein (DUF433 family)